MQKAQPKTVLLVEDQPAIRDLVNRFVGKEGFHLLEAEDGPQALELARLHQGEIAVMISDVQMPEMDGFTLCRILRETRPGTKVLFISGDLCDSMSLADTHGGFADFLLKPFALPVLLQKVKELAA